MAYVVSSSSSVNNSTFTPSKFWANTGLAIVTREGKVVEFYKDGSKGRPLDEDLTSFSKVSSAPSEGSDTGRLLKASKALRKAVLEKVSTLKPGEVFTRPGTVLPSSFAELYGIVLEDNQILCEATQYRHVDDSPKEEATPKTLNEILGLV